MSDEQLLEDILRVNRIIEEKNYGIENPDGSYNIACYEIGCDGEFSKNEHSDGNWKVGFYCSNDKSHYLGLGEAFSDIDKKLAMRLDYRRGDKDHALKKFNKWAREQYDKSETHEKNFKEFLKRALGK